MKRYNLVPCAAILLAVASLTACSSSTSASAPTSSTLRSTTTSTSVPATTVTAGSTTTAAPTATTTRSATTSTGLPAAPAAVATSTPPTTAVRITTTTTSCVDYRQVYAIDGDWSIVNNQWNNARLRGLAGYTGAEAGNDLSVWYNDQRDTYQAVRKLIFGCNDVYWIFDGPCFSWETSRCGQTLQWPR